VRNEKLLREKSKGEDPVEFSFKNGILEVKLEKKES